MNQSKGFLTYYLRMFIKPAETLAGILNDPKRLQIGLFSAAIPAIGYTIFYVFASYAGGAPSTVKPWLALPMEKYFTYAIFLAVPGYAISYFVAASILYLILRKFNRNTLYDDALAITGLVIGVASWSTMLHDLIDSLLAFIGVINMREYERMLNSGGFWDILYKVLMIIYVVWFFALFYKGIRHISKKGLIVSGLSAFGVFAVFQIVLVIFIR